MKHILSIVIFAVFLISVKCDTKSADKIVIDILKDTTVVENVDIKLEVPKFKQINNVKIEDLNQILYYLTSWFESRLNETNFVFKHVSNKTQVFVKSFDFNVNFEKGNAKIDVDLTEELQDKNRTLIQNITEELNIIAKSATAPTLATTTLISTITSPPITTIATPTTTSTPPPPTTITTVPPFETTVPTATITAPFSTTTDLISTTTDPATTTAPASPTTASAHTTTPPTLTTIKAPVKTKQNRTRDKIDKQINIILKKLYGEKENEIFRLEDFDSSYYDVSEDNATDYPITDYVEMYRDTTNEERIFIPTESATASELAIVTQHGDVNTTEGSVKKAEIDPDPVCHGDAFCKQYTKTVFPWVATIFVTSNDTQSQFSYFCDGSLITDKVIVTGARCMLVGNRTWEPQNVLVFLGKANLQSFAESEKVHKVKAIIIHPNFTIDKTGNVLNDVALLLMEDNVEPTAHIQTACIHAEVSMKESASTAWTLNGELMPIFYNANKNEDCIDKSEEIVCASYGVGVALCPSYGGTFASNQAGRWCLQGVFYGDPLERGLCFSKNVHYTLLKNYLTWIDDTVGSFKYTIDIL